MDPSQGLGFLTWKIKVDFDGDFHCAISGVSEIQLASQAED